MSEPADDRAVPDPDPVELKTTIDRFAKAAKEKSSRAMGLRQRADVNLREAGDLRQHADDLVHEAKDYEVEAAACEAAAAEARKDEQNAKAFARFLGADMEAGGASQIIIDPVRSPLARTVPTINTCRQFLTSLPLLDEPVGEEDVLVMMDDHMSTTSEVHAADRLTKPYYDGSRSWLARFGEFGAVLTIGTLIGRTWRR
jgi:hypothetical protein